MNSAMSDKEQDGLVLVTVHSLHQRDLLVGALRTAGVDTHASSTASQVLSALESQEIAAIVLHDDLPLGSGYELAQAIRRHQLGGELPIVLLTDGPWPAEQKAMAIEELGLIDLLSEPVDPKQVAELVLSELSGPKPGESDDSGGVLADRASLAEKRHVEAVAEGIRPEAAQLRGNLEKTPFPRLLHTLYRRQATGGLFLLKSSVKKIVYFRDGHPTYVKSNLLSECLGNVLVREKMISQADCERSLQRMRKERRPQGAVLIEMGALSPQNLVFALELQLQVKLYDIFGWTRGEFLFKDDVKMPVDVIRLDLSNAALIAEGVRKVWSIERLETALEPYLSDYVTLSANPELRFQHMALDEVEQAIVSGLDGRKRVQDVLEDAPLPDQRAAALLYALIVTGIAEMRRKTRPSTGIPAIEPPEEAGVRERLGQELVSLRSRDAFGVLGVAAASTNADVEQAYSRLAFEYHPDRFRRFSVETRQMAREIFGLIYNAYTQVDDENKRRVYRTEMLHSEVGQLSEIGKRSLRAEKRAREARGLMQSEKWLEAHHALLEAVDLCGDAADLRALLGWVTFQLDPESQSRLRESIRHLRRAIDLDSSHADSYVFLGGIYAAIGRHVLAEKQFERAVQCDPQNQEALEKLAHYQQQRKHHRGSMTAADLDKEPVGAA
jgi:DNA-binding response OmpR family regulator/tetratricopeptide (TPR) repeat protein